MLSIADRLTRRPARDQRGIAIVEFTIVLPLMLFLILAVAEVGFAFMQYNTLTRSVRDATRYASGNALNGQGGVVNLSANVISETKNVAVYGTLGGSGMSALPGFGPANVSVNNAGGGDITVIATYDYQPLLGTALPGVLGQGPMSTGFTMQAQVTMKAIG